MVILMRLWTASRQWILFWITFVGGVIIGNYWQFPLQTLAWLGVVWLLVFISGQFWKIELLSLSLTGLIAGVIMWQLTNGESWLHIELLGKFQELLITFRDSIVNKIFLALPEPHGSLLSGILLGNRVKLDRDLLEIFRVVGLSHIIAVSGYNLTVMTANIRSAFRPLLGRKLTLIVASIAVLSFVLLSGAPPSIIRAAVMAGIVLLGEYLGRPNRSLGALVTAAGVIVFFEPKIIFDIGFQLSIAATYGLIRLAPVITNAFRKTKLPEWLQQVLGETLAATAMTAPLIIIVFERLSIVSPLTNILVVPLIPLLMGIGVAAVVLMFIFAPVGKIAALLTWPILEWIIFISQKFSDWKFASTDVSLPVFLGVLIMLGLFIGSEYLYSQYLRTRQLPA